MPIKYTLLSVLCLLGVMTGAAQDDGRRLLRGQVLYRNTNVPNEHVINTTTERATITNDKGEFAIRVKLSDELVFTAINYQLEVITITEEILKRNRLVIEVNEKVTELDEVTVSPENQQKFLELKNEEFKEFEYETDQTAEVVNVAMDDPGSRRLQDGLNFKNIFKAIFLANKESQADREPLKVSNVLRKIYEDEFFVTDLRIPQDKIDAFLIYCDAQLPPQSLLRKDNEFQLIDFLVTQSKMYLKELDAQK
ncbi:MAG TPA: carboxypeptidase-like regulatory domain-containing protein [Eudoraea sp.]|nr:carboxypeptidase-like regulatory domain-containing protein [Eudoraea sp.]